MIASEAMSKESPIPVPPSPPPNETLRDAPPLSDEMIPHPQGDEIREKVGELLGEKAEIERQKIREEIEAEREAEFAEAQQRAEDCSNHINQILEAHNCQIVATIQTEQIPGPSGIPNTRQLQTAVYGIVPRPNKSKSP